MKAASESVGMNPEFTRNLWLEFGPQRLVLMGIVLGAAFLLAHLADEMQGGNNLANAAHGMFVLIVLFWGTRVAADGVVQEINGRTWDGQRMSAIGPWSMSWGKLFGSTSFVWAGGIACLAVYAVAIWNVQPLRDTLVDMAGWVAAAVLAQALGLLVSIVAIQKGRTPGRIQVTLFQGIGFAAGLAAMAPYWSGWSLFGTIRWYAWEFHPRIFLLFSFAAFAAWAVAGLYFMMRRELQLLNGPLPWLAFVVFCLAYTQGCVWDMEPYTSVGFALPLPSWSWAPLFVGYALVYAIAFGEPKDSVTLRQLAAFVERRDLAGTLTFAPRTALTLAVVILLGIWLMATGKAYFYRFVFTGSGNAVLIASLLFLVRDAALIFYATIGRLSARSDYVALVYLFLLYFLLPGIIATLGWHEAMSIFVPLPDRGAYGAIVPPLAESIVMCALLYFRVRRILRATG